MPTAFIEAPTTRRCYKCTQVKPLGKFVASKHNKYGYSYICKECQRARSQKYSDYYRSWRISKKYKLTVDEYEEIMMHGCTLCGDKTRINLCLDHCHNTGRIRGCLCQACNRRLGHIEFDRIWTQRALKYLGW